MIQVAGERPSAAAPAERTAGAPAAIASFLRSAVRGLLIAAAVSFTFLILLWMIVPEVVVATWHALLIVGLALCAVLLIHTLLVIVAAPFGLKLGETHEKMFIPREISVGLMHRVFFGAHRVMLNSGMALVASCLAGWLALYGDYSDLYLICCVLNLACNFLFFAAAGLRMVLIFAGYLGWCRLYDPAERARAPVAEYAKNPGLPLLACVRRLSTHVAIVAVALFGVQIGPTGTLLGAVTLQFAKPRLILGWSIAFAAGLLVLLFLVRFVVVALFFARYSLPQIIAFNLLAGGAGSLIVVLPGNWKALPILMLVLLVVYAFWLIGLQDPEGNRYMPDFLRTEARRQRLARIRAAHPARLSQRWKTDPKEPQPPTPAN